jgi:predicted nucleic acid-binding protein
MSKLILLDSGPLGVAANTRASETTLAFNRWLYGRTASGVVICVPEVADYEVRRELIRARRAKSLAKLDALGRQFLYLPVTTAVMRRAAVIWAKARDMGKPTADALSLDADVIIAAQADLLIEDGDEVTIATSNPKHLSLFVTAARWQDI